MNGADAWLLPIDSATRIAVGRLELVHIVESPEYFEVPKTPNYCTRVFFWNGRIIPIIDVSVLVNKSPINSRANIVAIANYLNERTQEYEYGGIRLHDTPVLKRILNEDGIQPSELPEKWKRLSVAAFKNKAEIVPIIDVSEIFLKRGLSRPH